MAVPVFLLILAFWLAEDRPGQSTTAASRAETAPPIVIQSFKGEISRTCSAKADFRLSVGRDPAVADQAVLIVEYRYRLATRPHATFSARQRTGTGRPGGRLLFRSSPITR